MLTRRTLLTGAFAAGYSGCTRGPAARQGAMRLAIHQNTSSAAGFRGSLEGWSRAGIRCAELTDKMLDGFSGQ